MKNLIKAILAAALGLGLLALLSAYTKPSQNEARNLAEYAPSLYQAESVPLMPKNSLDVVFIGSSQVYSAFSPMEMWRTQGIAGYCCTSSGQQAMTSYYFLSRFLRCQTPKLAVVDVMGLYEVPSQTMQNEFNNRSALDQMRFSREKLALARLLWEQQENGESFYSYFLPVLRFHARWKELKETDLTLRRHYDYARGYDMRYGDTVRVLLTEENFPILTQAPTEELADWDEEAAAWFRRIGELCAEHGVKLLLVRTPCSEWTLEERNTLNKLAAECGADALDFNDPAIWERIGLDWTADMLDRVHLNFPGARKLSLYFAERLAEDYGLPDHRGEEAYAFWDRDLRYYDTEVTAWTIRNARTGAELRELVLNGNYELLVVGTERAERGFAEALGIAPDPESLWISRWDGAETRTEYTDEARGFFGSEEYEINDMGIYMHDCNYMVGSGGLYYVVRDRLLGKIIDYGTVDPDDRISRT